MPNHAKLSQVRPTSNEAKPTQFQSNTPHNDQNVDYGRSSRKLEKVETYGQRVSPAGIKEVVHTPEFRLQRHADLKTGVYRGVYKGGGAMGL